MKVMPCFVSLLDIIHQMFIWPTLFRVFLLLYVLYTLEIVRYNLLYGVCFYILYTNLQFSWRSILQDETLQKSVQNCPSAPTRKWRGEGGGCWPASGPPEMEHMNGIWAQCGGILAYVYTVNNKQQSTKRVVRFLTFLPKTIFTPIYEKSL